MTKRACSDSDSSLVTAANPSAIVQAFPLQTFSLLTLPAEVFTRILTCLNPRSIAACNLVCKGLHQIFGQESVWQNLLQNHFGFNQFPNNFVFSECYKTTVRNIGRGAFCHSQEQLLVPDMDSENVVNVQTTENLIILEYLSGDDSETRFKIFDFKTKKFLFSIKEPVGDQFESAVAVTDDNKGIILGCESGKIMIYDLRSMECTKILDDQSITKYAKEVSFVGYCNFGDTLISIRVSDMQKITIIDIWDLKTETLQNTFEKKGFRASCNPVIVDEKLILGAHEKGIICFNLKTKADSTTSNIDIAESQAAGGCMALAIIDDKLFGIPIYDHDLQFWDLDSGAYLGVLRKDINIERNSLIASEGRLNYTALDFLNTLNFNVSDEMVFQELINLYRSKERVDFEDAHDRFCRMSQEAKTKIHSEFYKIVKHRITDKPEEDIIRLYYSESHKYSFPEEKAKAIENYLANCKMGAKV